MMEGIRLIYEESIKLLKRQGVEFETGLTVEEIAKIEDIYIIKFPKSLKEFLMMVLPISKGFFNWRNFNQDNVMFIKKIINITLRIWLFVLILLVVRLKRKYHVINQLLVNCLFNHVIIKRSRKNMKSNNRKKVDLLISWIIIAFMFIVPLGMTWVVYKIIMFIFPGIIFTGKDIVLLFGISCIIMIATAMVIATIKHKK